MIKVVTLLKKKSGMSRGAFIKRYEGGHVPLIKEVIPFYSQYRRSYIIDDERFKSDHVANAAPIDREFDVFTEMWFDTRENYEKMLTVLADPAIGNMIKEDEMDFLDRDEMSMYMVEEYN